jgi:hypothetical protein
MDLGCILCCSILAHLFPWALCGYCLLLGNLLSGFKADYHWLITQRFPDAGRVWGFGGQPPSGSSDSAAKP